MCASQTCSVACTAAAQLPWGVQAPARDSHAPCQLNHAHSIGLVALKHGHHKACVVRLCAFRQKSPICSRPSMAGQAVDASMHEPAPLTLTYRPRASNTSRRSARARRGGVRAACKVKPFNWSSQAQMRRAARQCAGGVAAHLGSGGSGGAASPGARGCWSAAGALAARRHCDCWPARGVGIAKRVQGATRAGQPEPRQQICAAGGHHLVWHPPRQEAGARPPCLRKPGSCVCCKHVGALIKLELRKSS